MTHDWVGTHVFRRISASWPCDTEAKVKDCPGFQAGAAVEAGAHAYWPLLASPQMWAKPLGLQDWEGAAPR